MPLKVDGHELKGLAGTAGSAYAACQTIVRYSGVVGNRKGSVSSEGPVDTTPCVPGVKALRNCLWEVRKWGVRKRRIVSITHIDLTAPDATQFVVCAKIN